MRYLEPQTLDEALAVMESEEDARCLAGGATLVAMMNADLVEPEVLISLRHITSLHGIRETAQGLRIGAMTTHNEIAADQRLTGAMAVVRSAAGQIAHDAIRNVGTIGGAISHGDPNADFPSAITAANASVEIASVKGTRSVAADDFFVDYLETALLPGEIVTAVNLQSTPEQVSGNYLKFSRADGDYATVSIAMVLGLAGNRCEYIRVAAGSCGPKPIRVAAAEERLVGSELSAEDIAGAGELLRAAADPVDDVRGSSEYRQMLIPRLLNRAINILKEQ
jgi:carbon-monoxide dehydrogenase medium subunit